jgi:hypothetical protein
MYESTRNLPHFEVLMPLLPLVSAAQASPIGYQHLAERS